MDRVVVVGASAAGLGVVESLRRDKYAGSIVLVGDETHLPYDRPPLSKQLLKGLWEPEKVQLRDSDQLAALDVELVLGSAAVAVDVENARVELADGTQLAYDGLVAATGVRPRPLPHADDSSDLFTIRTLDDAMRLRGALKQAKSVAVIGAGFLGAEAAAVARELGLQVHLIDILPAPMINVLGPEIAQRVAKLHRTRGINLHLGAMVASMERSGYGYQLALDVGSTVVADVVIVAIGSTPNSEWLSGTGIDITNGVLCDEYCLAAPGIAAAGDVARWYHPGIGRHVRVEHRMNATEQSRAAARSLLGDLEPFAPVSYFWTDQFDVKIQAYGECRADFDFETVDGDVDSMQFAGLYMNGTQVVGALTWNMPRAARTLRQAVIDGIAVQAS